MPARGREVSVLVVDDDPVLRGLFAETLAGYHVVAVPSGREALALLRRRRFDAVLLDLRMPGMDGLQVLRMLRAEEIVTPVIMVTGYGDVETAVAAMKLGARDYVEKPFDISTLRRVLAHAAAPRTGPAGDALVSRGIDDAFSGPDLIGVDPKVVALRTMIDRAAPTNAPILITGETGTGKELVARMIHARSLRASLAFVVVDCASVPSSLFESELFGYERGAFTGAVARQRGKLEDADGATLLLDEIGELTLDVQPKLLRFLQDGVTSPVGASRARTIDARVIGATNRDLATMVAEGAFRRDLFHRLNVVRLTLPPLRERKGDLSLLITHFVERFCRDAHVPTKGLSPECLPLLLDHDWPGNVRELENAIERACILTPGHTITPESLGPEFPGGGTETQGSALVASLAEIDRGHIADVLRREQWNITRAARVLGIHRATLYRKLLALRITSDEGGAGNSR